MNLLTFRVNQACLPDWRILCNHWGPKDGTQIACCLLVLAESQKVQISCQIPCDVSLHTSLGVLLWHLWTNVDPVCGLYFYDFVFMKLSTNPIAVCDLDSLANSWIDWFSSWRGYQKRKKIHFFIFVSRLSLLILPLWNKQIQFGHNLGAYLGS